MLRRLQSLSAFRTTTSRLLLLVPLSTGCNLTSKLGIPRTHTCFLLGFVLYLDYIQCFLYLIHARGVVGISLSYCIVTSTPSTCVGPKRFHSFQHVETQTTLSLLLQYLIYAFLRCLIFLSVAAGRSVTVHESFHSVECTRKPLVCRSISVIIIDVIRGASFQRRVSSLSQEILYHMGMALQSRSCKRSQVQSRTTHTLW